VRRRDVARLAWRERSFWLGAWVWGVDPDGKTMTVASTAARSRRQYTMQLTAPSHVSAPRVRSLIERRFVKKLELLRRDARLLHNMELLVEAFGGRGSKLEFFGLSEAGWRRWVSRGGGANIVAVIKVGPGQRPTFRLSVGTRRDTRKRLVRYERY
jgi:hypothetical protein